MLNLNSNSRAGKAETNPKKTVIWAIDAFAQPSDLKLQASAALCSLFPHAEIIPVYVLSELSFEKRGFSRILRLALKPFAFRSINQHIDALEAFNFKKPRVLVEESASFGECARKIVRFALKVHADVIIVGSHGKPTMQRLLGYSFSDAILSLSPLPVVVVGPGVAPCCRPPHLIVFAGNFNIDCHDAFTHILRLAEGFQAELHLFYKAQPGFSRLQDSRLLHHQKRRKCHTKACSHVASIDELGRCQELSRSKGIKTTFVCENSRETGSQGIVEYLSRLDVASALLATVAEAGTLAEMLLGNLIRDVVRRSRVPVYVAPRTSFLVP